jgi:hypothetical protein
LPSLKALGTLLVPAVEASPDASKQMFPEIAGDDRTRSLTGAIAGPPLEHGCFAIRAKVARIDYIHSAIARNAHDNELWSNRPGLPLLQGHPHCVRHAGVFRRIAEHSIEFLTWHPAAAEP